MQSTNKISKMKNLKSIETVFESKDLLYEDTTVLLKETE